MSNRTRCGLPILATALAAALMLSAVPASAQTPYVPYFGKNQVRYDKFDWHIYPTEHFTIYYYPEIEPHLERMASYAESAYQHISSELKYDLAYKVPLILFQTSSEFQEQNVIPGAAQENVGAFAEPVRNRIVMPMDEPPDLLYRLIVHELTHQFEFDIIPPGLLRRDMPLWINEGLSDYMTGVWNPLDMQTVRDAAVTDIVPKVTKLTEYGNYSNPRMIYNLGHAVFEFIESKWGKEGLRQYLFALRKSVIGGGEDAYEEAFKLKAEEFDQQFEKYLKERFKPFRDKERPADYGRNLAPDPEKSAFSNALTVEPSPSGDLLAVVTGNRKDREYDIVLVSAHDGSVIRNLTRGFDQDSGFEFIVTPARWNAVPWLSWSATGDEIAYFVRREKSRSLVIQNVLTRKIEQRIDLRTVDNPESPDLSPDGRRVVFAALQGGTGDIFMMDLQTKQITNLTKDDFGDSGPTWSPDGRYIVYVARVSQAEKLFRLDIDTGKKTQLTFGTHDDAAAQFLDPDTLVFPSTATDPSQPIDPDVARNGMVYNIWTLNMKSGELRQFTDALGGNVSPVVINDGNAPPKIGFISYYKGEYGLHTLDRREPIVTAASADFGSPGAVLADFQAPLSHTLMKEKIKKKGKFENMFLDGRPPVNVGVTSSGDVFGGTAVTFSDVLGDQQFNLYAASISQYRTLSLSYMNISRRLNWALQGYSQTQFFYGTGSNVFYDPSYAGIINRDLAIATQTIRGGSAFAIWPFNKYRRVELSGGILNYNEGFNDPSVQEYSNQYQQDQFGRPLITSGTYVPLGATFVQETTIFREFGPLAGNTIRAGYEVSPPIAGALSRQRADVDARYYLRLGGTGLLALRARSFMSWGQSPDFMYFGGNSEMRGYDYLQFVGNKSSFMNAELRFPFIEAMLTPLGVLGGVRGVLFANMGGASFQGQPFQWFATGTSPYQPILRYDTNPLNGIQTPIYGPTVPVSGLRLVDARASYGLGLETFALGFPIHFDWSWKTLMNKDWEDLLFYAPGAAVGKSGHDWFREPRFQVWIGYDF